VGGHIASNCKVDLAVVSYVIPKGNFAKFRSYERSESARGSDSEEPGPVAFEGLCLDELKPQGNQQTGGEGPVSVAGHVPIAFGSRIGSSRIDRS
jgi:hypothetical protein